MNPQTNEDSIFARGDTDRTQSCYSFTFINIDWIHSRYEPLRERYHWLHPRAAPQICRWGGGQSIGWWRRHWIHPAVHKLTPIVWISSRSNLITPTDSARNLRVKFGIDLSLTNHFAKVYHLPYPIPMCQLL